MSFETVPDSQEVSSDKENVPPAVSDEMQCLRRVLDRLEHSEKAVVRLSSENVEMSETIKRLRRDLERAEDWAHRVGNAIEEASRAARMGADADPDGFCLKTRLSLGLSDHAKRMRRL